MEFVASNQLPGLELRKGSASSQNHAFGRSLSDPEDLRLPSLEKSNSMKSACDALAKQPSVNEQDRPEVLEGRDRDVSPEGSSKSRDSSPSRTPKAAQGGSPTALHQNLPAAGGPAMQDTEAGSVVNTFSRTPSAPQAGSVIVPVAAQKFKFEIGRCYPVIPGKLFITAHRDEDHTYREIQARKKVFFFSSDLHESYMPFCADFGPVNLGVVFRFCEMLHQKMTDPRLQNRPLVYYTGTEGDHITNAAFLLGAYLVIVRGYSPEESTFWLQFDKETTPFLHFRDATFSKSSWDLRLKDCMRALHKAMQLRWLDFENFDLDDYETWDDPLNGDFHQVCPKFIAFKGPKDVPDDECTFTPEFYVDVFREKGVTAVVRLNEADRYNEKTFVKCGIKHYDLYFDDCTVPPKEIVKKFLKLCEETSGVIAVHCAAGLGRTGTLIALWMMKHCQVTAAEAIGWLRIVRPGSVIGPQQRFLTRFDKFDWSLLDQEQNSMPATRKAADATEEDSEDRLGPHLIKDLLSLQMAEQVRQGVLNRARK